MIVDRTTANHHLPGLHPQKIHPMKNKFASPIRIIACLTTALVIASVARADAPDTSTPKKAAIAFAKAVQAGDMTTAKTLATGSDSEWKLIKMMSETMVAVKAFSAAAAEKFGDQGKLPPDMAMDLSADFESSDEKIDGDTATLISQKKPDDKYPPQLKKTATGWVLDLSNLEKDPASAPLTQIMPVMTKAMTTVTADIKAGKYATMQDAMTAFGQAMNAGMAAAGGGAPGGSAPGQ
jgi:hypothetical protein